VYYCDSSLCEWLLRAHMSLSNYSLTQSQINAAFTLIPGTSMGFSELVNSEID